jgi:holo-[acyl-carrier protein] synthase
MASRAVPLPFPLRIGTDICQVSRIYRILRSPRGPRFVRRVLTEEEISRPDQDPISILLRAAELQETPQGKKPAVPPSELRKAAVFMAGR